MGNPNFNPEWWCLFSPAAAFVYRTCLHTPFFAVLELLLFCSLTLDSNRHESHTEDVASWVGICARFKMLGKKHAVGYFWPECYSSHPFIWNFRFFLTCISRGAVARNALKKWQFQLHTGDIPEFFQTVGSGFGDAISYPKKGGGRCCVLRRCKPLLVKNSCGLVYLKKAPHEIRKMMSSPSYSTPHDTLETKKPCVYV